MTAPSTALARGQRSELPLFGAFGPGVCEDQHANVRFLLVGSGRRSENDLKAKRGDKIRMATQQTQTKRRAAGKKAAATRRRNAARKTDTRTKASARSTARSASQTSRSAQRTGKLLGRSAGRRLEAASARFDELGRRAERSLLIQVGVAATLRDAVTRTARTYTSLDRVTRELDRYERRGARVVGRGQRTARRRQRELRSDARGAQRSVQHQANELRKDAGRAARRVTALS